MRSIPLHPLRAFKLQRSSNTQNGRLPYSAAAPPKPFGPAAPGHIRRSVRKSRLLHWVRYWIKPTVAFIIYVLAVCIAATATKRDTLLGSVNESVGTWFLAILAKAGDVAFGFAVADAFDTLSWRRMTEEQFNNNFRLEWFLALASSTGVEGLFRLLKRGLRKGQGSWRSITARLSFARLLFILILIPGPGIIFVANIEQKELCFNTRTVEVSGGLADYDPRSANIYRTVWGPEISKLVRTMLRDNTVIWRLKPASQECKEAGKSCKSYLIAGAYQTIAPWPFTEEDEGINGFRLYGAPFYQVDIWDTTPGLTFSESKDCTLYGGLNATDEFSMVLCIKQDNPSAPIVAGWKSCQQGYDEEGKCLMPGASNKTSNWSTSLTFHRLTADLVFSRTSFNIIEVGNLSTAVPYPISPDQLLESLNNVLYRPRQVSNDLRSDLKSQQYVLTQNIGSNLWFQLQDNLHDVPFAGDWLRNLLSMPVYIFQPTILALDNQQPLTLDGTQRQQNLPDENYIAGSYCRLDKRSVPGWGTVLAYTIVAGVVLVFIVTSKLIASYWKEIEISEFPTLDHEVLTVLVDAGGREIPPLRERFPEVAYAKREVLDRIGDLKIALRHL